MKKIVIAALLLCSCGKQDKDERLLEQAAHIHNEAVGIAAGLEEEISAHAEISPDSAKQFLQEIEEWESSLVEVPGNTHASHEHGNHAHDHTPPAVTAEEMLTIQQELRQQILALKTRVQAQKGN